MVEVHIFRTAAHTAISDQNFNIAFRPSFSPEWPKCYEKFLCRTARPKAHEG